MHTFMKLALAKSLIELSIFEEQHQFIILHKNNLSCGIRSLEMILSQGKHMRNKKKYIKKYKKEKKKCIYFSEA